MPDTQGGLKRPRRWRRLVLVALAVLATAAVALFLTSGPRLDAWARARLRVELARALGRPVSVGEVHVSLTSSSFVANDIVVGEVPPGKGRVLEVPQAAGRIRLRSLLRNHLELESLHVISPRVTFAHRGERLEGPIPVRSRENLVTRATGSLTVVLRRLEIDDGTVSFDDRTAPFWCRADGLRLVWQGDELGNGSGTLATDRISGGSGDAAQLGSLRVQGVLQGGDFTGRLDGTWPAGSARIEAAITLPSSAGVPATGTLRGTVHLEESARSSLITSLLHLEERLEGSVDLEGTFHFRGSAWGAQGRLDARNVRYADVSAETASMQVRAGDGLIDLHDVDLRALGGRITGSLQVATVKGGALKASAHADGLSLQEVLARVGLASPLTGVASGDAQFAVTLGDMDSLTLRATTRFAGGGAPRGGPPRSRRYPVTGDGLLTIEKQLVVFDSPRLASGGVSTAVHVEKILHAPETRVRLDAALATLADGSSLIESFLADQPDGGSLPWDSARLTGSGSLEGDLLFREDTPVKGRVEFAFHDFAYEGIGGATLAGSALADGATLSFTVPRAEKAGGTLALEGRFPEGHEGLSRITGELRDWPVDDVLARIGAPQGTTARGSGPLTYRFAGSGSGETSLRLTDVRVGDVVFPDGAFEASLRDERIDIARLTLDGPQATLTASGSYAIGPGALTGRLDASRVDTAIARPWLRGLPLTGHATIAASLSHQDGQPSWTARVVPEEDLAFSGRPIREIRLDVTGDGGRATYEGVFGDLARFSGSVEFAEPHRGEGRFELTSVPVAPLLSLSNPDLAAQTGGEVSGTIQWSGPLDDLTAVVATASLDDVRLALGAESFETARPAALRLEHGLLRFDDVELVSGGAHLRVRGSYPVDEAGSVDLAVDGNLDLGALSTFVPELTASGDLRAAVKIQGPRSSPALSGTFDVDKGRLRLIDFPLVADRVHLSGRLDETGLTAEGITAILGGGAFSGDGHVDFDGLSISAFHLQGRVANAALALPEGFRGQYSGSLRFEQKRGEVPVLSGDLELVRGIWQKNFNLDSLSLGQRSRPPVFQVSSPGEGLQRTRLELKIQADDNVWCHNDLADVEGEADLSLGGTVSTPQITGRFKAFEGGEMRFRRVRYVIDQALVTFPAGVTFNPEYDITAEAQVRDYEVRMHLSGNLDALEYELTSNPPLPQQQILALLVTGVAAPEESTIPADQLAGQARSAVGTEIGSFVGGRLEKWTGFEEIRIEPFVTSTTSTTTDPTTRVTIGKRISPRVFVRTAVSLNSPEDPIYQVEYVATRKVRLLLERGELGSVGGGVRYGTRFFLPSVRREGEAQGTIVKRREEKKIAEVRFLGDAGLDPTVLRRAAHMRIGSEFTRQKMVEGADRLKKRFVKEGYLEASVRPALREAPEGQVSVDYTIERGPKVVVAVEGAGTYEGRIRKTLKSLWQESGFGGDFAGEAEGKIRRLLQEEGFYACLVKADTVEKDGTKHVTFRIDTGERVSVQSVELRGVRSIPESEVRKQILTEEGSLFRRQALRPSDVADDVVHVENLYRSKGYLEAQAHAHITLSPDARRAFVTIEVKEGRASILRSVKVEGEHAMSADEIMKLVQSRTGEPFLPAQVVADRDAIRRKLDLAGYPEATVEEQIVREGESVDLTYRIVEGPERRVASIAVEGNTLTNDSVVLREVDLQPGEPISVEKMRRTRQNLMRTGLFSDAQIRYEQGSEGTAGEVLRVRVSEGENIVLGLGGGYDTVNGPRASVDLADVNLFGTGRYAGISAIYGGRLQRGQVNFKEPRVFGGRWSSTLSTFYEKFQRDSFSQRQVGSSALLERKTGGPVSHYLRYSVAVSEVFDLKVPESTFRQENIRLDLGRLRLANVGYAIVRDTRNDPFAATKGTYASADLRTFAHPIGSEKRFAKLFVQGSYYRNLPLGLIWSSTLRVGASFRGQDEAIPLQERFFAGGDSTVRGFRQDRLGFVSTDKLFRNELQDTNGDGTPEQVRVPVIVDTGTLEHETLRPLGGESLVILNNELRHKLYGGLSATVFLDAGNTYPHATDVFSGHMRYAAGLGLRFETPVGPLRLEYGRKIDRERGESPGEFILSLGQTF